MENQMPPKWIATDGGPLIALDLRLLDEWNGIPQEDASSTTPNDYKRACAINDYLGTIPVGDGWGVVLGDMPLQMAWRPLEKGGGGILVRWFYAPNRSVVHTKLQNLHDVTWEASDVRLLITSGRCIVFDAAWGGSEIRDDWSIVLDSGARERVGAYLDRLIPDARDEHSEAIKYAGFEHGLTERTIHLGCAIFTLRSGEYRIETAHFQPNEETYLLLHRLSAT
jgi:hypothetical protein